MSVKTEHSFPSLYRIEGELGKGAFSVVKKAVELSTSKEYAVKIINTKRLTTRDLGKLEREARICKMLKHANIVQLHKVFHDEDVRYMVFDLITGGELFDDIVAREFYTEKDASHCILQILESIKYCHDNSIIHRDIKPENLLLESRMKGANVKLADFGLAVDAMDSPHYYGFAGTPGYLAPEVLRKEPYTSSVDLWACGVVLYILLVGYPPFWDDDQRKLFEQIKTGRYEFPSPEWDTVTEPAKDLIKRMLEIDQTKRITAAQALDHAWIKNRERVASVVHRQETINGLRRFNARRKLKAAVHTALLITKSSSTFFSSKKANTTEVPVEEHIEEEDTGNHTAEEKEIIRMTQKLIDAVGNKDFTEYSKLCDADMTALEPEACDQLVTGLDFHKFYFDNLVASSVAIQQHLVTPKARMLGDSGAYCAFIRLIQCTDKDGVAHSVTVPETRIWQKIGQDWKCVHIHRSTGGKHTHTDPPGPPTQGN